MFDQFFRLLVFISFLIDILLYNPSPNIFICKTAQHVHRFPWKRGRTLQLNTLGSPSPKDALSQIWLKLVQWFLRKKLNFVNVFLIFRNYLPLEKGWAHHLNKFESPSPKEAMYQVWLTLVQSFLRRRFFFNFVNVFLLFRNYLPLEKGGAFHLNKLDYPSPKDALCQVWLKFYPLGV